MSAPEIEVLFTRDGEEVLRRLLAPGAYIIGRWHESDLHVIADLVSRQHARLVIEGSQVFLEDLGSSNGTFIDGQAITELTPLPPGTRAQLGVLTLEIPFRKEANAPSEALAELLPDEFLRGKKYEVGPMIAQGGMGAIMDAREATIRRSVAMKVMLTEGTSDDLRRFIEEAQITGQLEHPNIVPVHELGLDEEGKLFYTMKLVKGITLLKILQLLGQGVPQTVEKYPLAELLTVFQKVCDALAFAHSKGVIHRDLKPENVMIARYGEVLVMDWGIAKLVKPAGAPKDAGGRSSVNVKSTTLIAGNGGNPFATMSGAIMGTPGFMSPEQARGDVDSLDARSDIFALGSILYTILTLEFPFDGTTVDEILDKVKTAPPVTPTLRVLGTGKKGAPVGKGAPGKAGKGKPHLPGGRVPEALSAITMKALAMRPRDRYQTVEEFQADLAAFQGGFATSAEQAGVGRQLWLLVMRNKALAACAAGLFVLINTFGITVLVSQRRMAAALEQLRGTAPTFHAQGRNLVDEGKLDEALDKIAFAIQLAPNNPDYHSFRANLLQASQRLDEAAVAYKRVLTLKRRDDAAAKNLGICQQLLADNGGGPLKPEIQGRLVDQLIAQGRRVEAAPLSALLGKVSSSAEPAIRARIKEYIIQPGWSDARLSRLPSGSFLLDLSRLQVGDFGKLQGLPIAELKLENAALTDLTGIEKLSHLIALNVSSTKLADLTPLRGMKLRRLNLSATNVIDLAPLTGMPLESLSINSVRTPDLTALRGAPLRSLSASNTIIADLSVIAVPSLEELNINYSRVSDLTPLRACPKLRHLSLANCGSIFDITALGSFAALQELHLPAQTIDCAFLKEHPSLRRIRMDAHAPEIMPASSFWSEIAPKFALAAPVRTALQRACPKVLPPDAVAQTPEGQITINITGLPISDLAALRGQPIRELHASNSRVWDLSALEGAPLRLVHLSNTGFLDCRTLAAFPQLEEIIIPPKINYIESLRSLPKLRHLGHQWSATTKRADTTAEEFWAAWDARRK